MRTGSERASAPGTAVAPARRLSGDGGAIMAEAALITPFFIFMLFGILEFGGSFRDYLTLNNAAQAGSRQASVAANSADADFQILTVIKREIGAMPLSQVQRIVVFHASGPNSSAPAACLSGSAGSNGTGNPLYTDACNVYSNSSPTWNSLASTDFGCGTTPAQPDRFWCPTKRKYAAEGSHGPPDFVGVYIEIKHKFYTGLFGNDQKMTKTAIIQIEPQTLGAGT